MEFSLKSRDDKGGDFSAVIFESLLVAAAVPSFSGNTSMLCEQHYTN